MRPPSSSPSPGDSVPPLDGPLLTEHDAGGGVIVVRCRARFLVEPGVIAAFKNGLQGLAARLASGSGVVVNLSGIEHLSSSALLALILFRRQVRDEHQGEVETCEAVPWVAESFRLIARFSWDPYPNEAAAIEAVRAAIEANNAAGAPRRSIPKPPPPPIPPLIPPPS
ncbi:hypothetical protein [Tautonia marina]|uniref:hypothetical protein n=1 Tax=Tautonia marina TaxID=2653855 RepID=UPI00126046FB|nr:hypothetical protein [Tautonia marina]